MMLPATKRFDVTYRVGGSSGRSLMVMVITSYSEPEVILIEARRLVNR